MARYRIVSRHWVWQERYSVMLLSPIRRRNQPRSPAGSATPPSTTEELKAKTAPSPKRGWPVGCNRLSGRRSCGAGKSWNFGGFVAFSVDVQPLEDSSMKKLFAISLLGTALACSTALAQAPAPAPAERTAPSATTSTGASANKLMLKGNWRASKLMGLDVYNESNEKLGDVNEIILDKSGKVTAVVIGVGGFLGMGEHDIAVSMDKLKFVEDQVRTSTATTTKKDATTGTATAPANSTATRRTADANDWVPDHAVMSATKEQLKAMPQFKYSDYN
jgi:sporulation protein YlmC with PRC-barrel domain